MKLGTCIALGLVALLSLPELASAGPLARTGRAIDNKSSGGSSSGSGSSGRSSGSHASHNPRDGSPRDHHRNHYRSHNSASDTHTGTLRSSSANCDGCSAKQNSLVLLAPEVELGLAGQKVRGSDGSFRMDARILWGRLGLYAKGDHYFERISSAEMPKFSQDARSEYIRVNLFEAAVLGRILDSKLLQADLHAGLGIAASSVFATLPGTAIGFSVKARMAADLSFGVEGRAMSLRHNIRAFEGASGVQWKKLWLGYRALQFDVGQVLQGPEAGVRVRF